MKMGMPASLVLSAGISSLAFVPCGVVAQSASMIPIPFVSDFAGLASGSVNALCANGIPNNSGVNLGDGCLPTQAKISSPWDVKSDAYGDIFIAENSVSNFDIRVVYNGNPTLAKLLMAANPNIANFTPVVGDIYTLAGTDGSSGLTYNSTTNLYYCNNAGPGGLVSSDLYGDGCPATLAPVKPHGIAVDGYGNVFFASMLTAPEIRVVYSGGTQVANLITLENPSVTAPHIGYVYKIAGGVGVGYSGDGGLATKAEFVSPYGIVLDSAGNIYFTDGALQTTSGSTTVELAANNVREINATTGVITTVAGENTCTYSTTTGCPYSPSAVDGSVAAGALLNTPWFIFLDASNNLYIIEYYTAKIRVVYQGGSIAGIANPVIGHIYTFAGGGTLTANGTLAGQVQFGQLAAGGIDGAGNIYADDTKSGVIWEFNPITGIGNIIAGAKSSSTVALKGAYCAGSAGPISTDNYGDGCPAIQSYLTLNEGTIAADPAGNLYTVEQVSPGVVRKLSNNNQYPSTTVGNSVSQPLAFEALVAGSLNGESLKLEGSTASDYTDPGANDTCGSSSSISVGTVCVFNVVFDPAHAGQRMGGIQLGVSASTATSVTVPLGGIGLGPDVAVDPGTMSTLGAGLTPTGVATDLLGNVYVSDKAGNRVLKGLAAGTALTAVVSGLNAPAQIAVDSYGNLYIADSGNNRLLETTSAGSTIGIVGSGLSSPTGVAIDAFGNVYIADTGNNRVVRIFANGNQQTLPLTAISSPTELAVDATGDLFILNSGADSIVEYSNGTQSTVALDSGVVPAGIAVDPAGDVYVADSAGLRVLSYPPNAISGNLLVSNLNMPVALASDADADLFVADKSLTGVLELRRSVGNITFPITNVGSSTSSAISTNNVGNALLDFTSSPLTKLTGSSFFTVSPSSANGCMVGATYGAGSSCNFTANFLPTSAGSNTATVTFNTNATNNGNVSALLTAKSLLLVNTSLGVSIVSPVPSIYYDQTVNLTLTLSPVTVTVTPTGTFSIILDGKSQGTQPVTSLTLSLPNLSVGTHVVSVSYSGDTVYASSSATVTFTVTPAITTTSLTVPSVSASGVAGSTFTAIVSSATTMCGAGTVAFYSGASLLGSSSLLANGTATYTTSTLSFTQNSFTAVYSGSSTCAGSTSTVVIPSGDFYIVPSSANVTSVSQDGNIPLVFSVSSIYGGTGNVTPSCTGLPVNSLCRFQPETIALANTTQTGTVTFYTDILGSLAYKIPLRRNLAREAASIPFCLGISLLLYRRRIKWKGLAALMAGLLLISSMMGCGSATGAAVASKGLVTPAGTYNINVVFTGSDGLSTTRSVPVTVTVIQDSGPF